MFYSRRKMSALCLLGLLASHNGNQGPWAGAGYRQLDRQGRWKRAQEGGPRPVRRGQRTARAVWLPVLEPPARVALRRLHVKPLSTPTLGGDTGRHGSCDVSSAASWAHADHRELLGSSCRACWGRASGPTPHQGTPAPATAQPKGLCTGDRREAQN